MKHTFNKIVNIFLLSLISIPLIAFGYWLRLSHEEKNIERMDTEAMQDLRKLEDQFYEAWTHPKDFFIFQRQFHLYPLKNNKKERQFSYAGSGDNTRQKGR